MLIPLPYLLRGNICTDRVSSPLRYLQVQQESSALVGCVFGSLDLCVFRDVVTQQAETRDARPHIFLSIHQAMRTALVGTNTGSCLLIFTSVSSFAPHRCRTPHTTLTVYPYVGRCFVDIYIYQALALRRWARREVIAAARTSKGTQRYDIRLPTSPESLLLLLCVLSVFS